MESVNNLENFYNAFDHFVEVVVLLNKCCSRSTNIDELDIDSLRYIFYGDLNSAYEKWYFLWYWRVLNSIIIISLFNVDAKKKVENYNKKELFKRNSSIKNKLQYI